MSKQTLTVAERVAALHNIFHDFGIPVLPNSSLAQAIQMEFGRGKRSKLTQLLLELHQTTEANKLVACIGTELKQSTDPEVLAIARVLEEQIPPLLDILDVQHSVNKRAELLGKLLAHFQAKLPNNLHTERLHRMLLAAQKNVLMNLQVQTFGQITTNVGTTWNITELKKFGNILQGITPALIAIDQPDYPVEQKVQHCITAMRVLAIELRAKHLQTSADILDNVHWLAKVTLPQLAEPATIEQALQNLGVSVGRITTKIIKTKAAQAGLTDQEITQLLYASAHFTQIQPAEQTLLSHTQTNQQYAAICAYVAKLAHELKHEELSKIAVAGICLASLRQTYYEAKTDNLRAANFTEAFGTILAGVGAITQNSKLTFIGNSIISGVATYAGIMAVPGGATIAVPLAVCSVLTKVLLHTKEKNPPTYHINNSANLNILLEQICTLQRQINLEFAHLYQALYDANQQAIAAIDRGFMHLAQLVQHNNTQILRQLDSLGSKLQDLQWHMQREFMDLYLEYIHDPLEELDYIDNYGDYDQNKIESNKHKLVMWLLYKSKHPNVNGGKLQIDNLTHICAKLHDSEGILSLLNKYVNTQFAQTLPEDLPHIATWLLAAHTYVWVSAKYPATMTVREETKILTDVMQVGEHVLGFVTDLASNSSLWLNFTHALQQVYLQLSQRWAQIKLQIDTICLQDLARLKQYPYSQVNIMARAAAVGQLEPFTIIDVDITHLWQQYIVQHIPLECQAAVANNLGKWNIDFTVEQSVNKFYDVYLPYGPQLLPDHARDVLFKIDVSYQAHGTEAHLLTSSWFAYDLHDAKQRFEQYYQLKFKYGLRHNMYHWISLNGRANRVDGHGDTATHKLIDYDRLATIYQNWLGKAQPINQADILLRLRKNVVFTKQYANLLLEAQCTTVHVANTVMLQITVHEQLLKHMLQQRCACAAMLQQEVILTTALEKIDLYGKIIAVYMHLLNIKYVASNCMQQFRKLIDSLQQATAYNEDLLAQITTIFMPVVLHVSPNKEYLAGEFYLKMQAAMSKLSLLYTNLTTDRMRLMAKL